MILLTQKLPAINVLADPLLFINKMNPAFKPVSTEGCSRLFGPLHNKHFDRIVKHNILVDNDRVNLLYM